MTGDEICMEYYIEMYNKIVSVIYSTSEEIESIKEDISECQNKIKLFDEEISNRRDDVVCIIELLEDKEKRYNFSIGSLLKYKKNIFKNFCIILSSLLLVLVYYLLGNIIGNICLIFFLAISLPCGFNIVCKYINSLIIKKKISGFDVSSNRSRIGLFREKLNSIDIDLEDVYSGRDIISQKIDSLRSEMNEKRWDIKHLEGKKRRLEGKILEYLQENALLSCDRDIDGQIFMDEAMRDVYKRTKKL